MQNLKKNIINLPTGLINMNNSCETIFGFCKRLKGNVWQKGKTIMGMKTIYNRMFIKRFYTVY